MARYKEGEMWWSNIECPICGDSPPHPQYQAGDNHEFICHEQSHQFRDD